jgi:excisionase family DNA binding protein
MSDHSDVYLTTQEAAAYLRLSPNTLAQWRCWDRGPAFVRFGRAVRYRKADLDAWASTQRHNAA